MPRKETPRILHQTWKSKEIPAGLQPYVQSCQDLHTQYEYRLWLDADLRSIVAQHYPQYLTAFDGFQQQIERVDFARYAILHQIGGIYADLDIECRLSLEPWVARNKPILGDEPLEHRQDIYEGREHVICNALMISPPGHPVWKRIMDYIVANYRRSASVVYNTGPMALTKLYDEDPTAYDDVVITPACVFYPQTDHRTSRVLDGVPYISRECETLQSTYTIHRWSHTYSTGSWDWTKVSNTARVLARAYYEEPGFIAGVTIGSVVVFAALVAGIILWRRRQTRQSIA